MPALHPVLYYSKQCPNNFATLCCSKNRRCDSSSQHHLKAWFSYVGKIPDNLIFSPSLQNFMLFLHQKMSLLFFSLSLLLFSRWASLACSPTFSFSAVFFFLYIPNLWTWQYFRQHGYRNIFRLTNRPQFSMFYTLIDDRNDAIKCPNLKWNHEPQVSGITAKFWTLWYHFYGLYECRLWKIVVDLFFTITFIFSFLWSFSKNNCAKRRFSYCFLYFCSTFVASSTNSQSEISPQTLKFGYSLSMFRSKIIFTKNRKQNNRQCVTCYVISMVFTLIGHI